MQPFTIIKKLALRTNGIKSWSTINQSYHIIHRFDLHRALPKYIITFLNKNEGLMIGLTEKWDYSILHFMVTVFIRTVVLSEVNPGSAFSSYMTTAPCRNNV